MRGGRREGRRCQGEMAPQRAGGGGLMGMRERRLTRRQMGGGVRVLEEGGLGRQAGSKEGPLGRGIGA